MVPCGQKLSAIGAALVLFCLPSCSRENRSGANQRKPVERNQALSGAQTVAELQLEGIVELALRQHADWDAEVHIAEANALTRVEKFAQSAAHCLAAQRLQPQNLFAGYQLACTFALWGQQRLALKTLGEVVRDGFWGYEMMRDDSDLDQIKQVHAVLFSKK
jgi:hypothetical protein